MAVFNAADAVEALRFDFTVYRPAVPDDPNHPDYEQSKLLADEEWAGVIPEPTDDAVEHLFRVALPAVNDIGEKALEKLIAEQRDARRAWWDGEHPGQEPLSVDAVNALEVPPELLTAEQQQYRDVIVTSRREARQAALDAVAEFTQGHPSRRVLESLPWRAFQMFNGWLTGQFSPEALAAAMNP